jgi:hypothetical protein
MGHSIGTDKGNTDGFYTLKKMLALQRREMQIKTTLR